MVGAGLALLLGGCSSDPGGGDTTSATHTGTTSTGTTTTTTTATGTTTSTTTETCAKPCGGNCCEGAAICIDDENGNQLCATPCTSSAQCDGAHPCCAVLKNGGGACMPAGGNYLCRCTTGVECQSGACGPAIDAQLNPVGPYVCRANDGKPYHGCNGATTCDSGYCCMGDAVGNLFCASQCQNDSQCGKAHCQTYDNSHTTCLGALACGP
jgi:hypothetical protein